MAPTSDHVRVGWCSALLACICVCVVTSCVDTGVIGSSCDDHCERAPCASGLPPCELGCAGNDECGQLTERRVCDVERGVCVECQRSSDCGDDEMCSNNTCVLEDDDDELDETDASD